MPRETVARWSKVRIPCFGAPLRLLVCMSRIGSNGIGAEGAAAIGAGLASVPQLQTLEYVLGGMGGGAVAHRAGWRLV